MTKAFVLKESSLIRQIIFNIMMSFDYLNLMDVSIAKLLNYRIHAINNTY